MTALVSGATGLVGQMLLRRLERPAILSRSPDQARASFPGLSAFGWDPSRGVPREAMNGVRAVFHLAGEPVASGRWSRAKKDRIRESRVAGTRTIVDAIRDADVRPDVLVCASAVGYYGSRGDELLTEESAPGVGFLAEVCQAWEREALAAESLGVRVVCARIGIVLARDGGALAKMLPAFRFGVGGPLASGAQWMPWIHVEDAVGLLLHAAPRPDLRGALNVCAPEPVTNRDFSRALGRALRRPAWLGAPSPLLRLALGEMADVVLASQRVLPAKAGASAYRFAFESLDDALRDVTRARATGAIHEPAEARR